MAGSSGIWSITTGMMGYDENAQPQYGFDVEKAKELLAEAGYPNGIEVELVYNTSDGHKRIAEALQAQMKQAGIDMTIKNVDWVHYSMLLTDLRDSILPYGLGCRLS